MVDKIEQLGIDIRNRVNKEKLVLTEVFKEEAEKFENMSDVLSLALAVSPEGRIDQAIIIIYTAFDMTPDILYNIVKDLMSGKQWDRFAYIKLNIVEDLLGLKRDSLYSIFRKD